MTESERKIYDKKIYAIIKKNEAKLEEKEKDKKNGMMNKKF